MVHSDDSGLILPPRLAPTQVVLVPIYRKEEEKTSVLETAERIRTELDDAGIRVELDAREGYRPGWKFHEHEVQGVPVRLALGPRDVQNASIELVRRDTGGKENVSQGGLTEHILATLDEVQKGLFDSALAFRESHTTRVDTYDDFKSVLEDKGGFILAHWDGSAETEERIKEETRATLRLVPLDQEKEAGVDPVSGEPSAGRVYYARAY